MWKSISAERDEKTMTAGLTPDVQVKLYELAKVWLRCRRRDLLEQNFCKT